MVVIKNYEVSHPIYGTVVVPSIGPDSATVEAFEQWGIRELWRREVANCTVRALGFAGKPRCRRCAREYGRPGDKAGCCPECERVLEHWKREIGRLPRARGRQALRSRED